MNFCVQPRVAIREKEPWESETHDSCAHCSTHTYGPLLAAFCRLEEEWIDDINEQACCDWKAI